MYLLAMNRRSHERVNACWESIPLNLWHVFTCNEWGSHELGTSSKQAHCWAARLDLNLDLIKDILVILEKE